MEQWNKLVGLVKEFYIAFGQQEFLEKYHLEPVYLNERLVYELLEVYPNHFKLFRKRLKEGYYSGIMKEK